MRKVLARRASFCAAIACSAISFSFSAKAEDSMMCKDARAHFPNEIAIFCKDEGGVEQPKPVPPIQRSPASVEDDPPPKPGPPTGQHCKLTDLYPYAGICLMKEIDAAIDKVFPLKNPNDGDPSKQDDP
jgi:hypothetical protein